MDRRSRLPQELQSARDYGLQLHCVNHTGTHQYYLQYTQGVPIEVAPFAYAKLLQNLHHLGSPSAALRMAKASKAGPIVSDNGNFVIDAPFGSELMKEPLTVRRLKQCAFGHVLFAPRSDSMTA